MILFSENEPNFKAVYKACDESLTEFYQSASKKLDKMIESHLEERLERLMENHKGNNMFKQVMRVRKLIKRWRKVVQIKKMEKATRSRNTEMKESGEAHIDVPIERNAALPRTPTDIDITEL